MSADARVPVDEESLEAGGLKSPAGRRDGSEVELQGLMANSSESEGTVVGKPLEERPASAVASAAKPSVEEQPLCKLMGIPMSWVALVALTGCATVQPILTNWTRAASEERVQEGGSVGYLNSSIVLFGEITKAAVAFILVCREEGGLSQAASAVKSRLTDKPLDTAKITVPALLYALQGNLLFYCMDKLSPPVYTVSYQLKILTTAVMSVILLGKKIGPVKWLALVILTLGVSMVQMHAGDKPVDLDAIATTTTAPEATGKEMGDSVKGLLAVLLACCTSALAGVYLEKMLTQSEASIWMRNVQLGTVGAVMAAVAAGGQDYQKIIEGGLLQGFTEKEFFLFCFHAMGGLCSAAVLKYAGNILKCFSAAISVVLVSIIAAFFTSFSPDVMFVGGVCNVIGAVFLYNVGFPSCMEDWWSQAAKAVDTVVAPQAAKHLS